MSLEIIFSDATFKIAQECVFIFLMHATEHFNGLLKIKKYLQFTILQKNKFLRKWVVIFAFDAISGSIYIVHASQCLNQFNSSEKSVKFNLNWLRHRDACTIEMLLLIASNAKITTHLRQYKYMVRARKHQIAFKYFKAWLWEYFFRMQLLKLHKNMFFFF